MGNPFLFADRFSGAVVHLTTGGSSEPPFTQQQQTTETKNARDRYLAQAFRD
ncbi:hypothetical protein [Massilia alkalitolerans]|uniref:hypothetical protein n=1 Tax=Massilia alkalitolerans TaxID=286638 RepID=UPI0028B238F9|nr:hypothetical protein [Massilia alkalitolerans]